MDHDKKIYNNLLPAGEDGSSYGKCMTENSFRHTNRIRDKDSLIENVSGVVKIIPDTLEAFHNIVQISRIIF